MTAMVRNAGTLSVTMSQRICSPHTRQGWHVAWRRCFNIDPHMQSAGSMHQRCDMMYKDNRPEETADTDFRETGAGSTFTMLAIIILPTTMSAGPTAYGGMEAARQGRKVW